MSRRRYNRLVVRATKMFLEKRESSPNLLQLLQQVIGEVFREEVPPNAGNDVLTLCRQVALAKLS